MRHLGQQVSHTLYALVYVPLAKAVGLSNDKILSLIIVAGRRFWP